MPPYKCVRTDGVGCWMTTRRLNRGHFQWIERAAGSTAITVIDADAALYRDHHSRLLMEAMLERMQRDQQILEERNRAPKTRQAIRYALGQWEALMRYPDHFQASIDNNRSEQAIRPTKLGAKNWLFIGHPQAAGKRSAILYSLVQNCKHLGIDPQPYLIDVLERLTHCGSDPQAARELQPRFWKKSKPNWVGKHRTLTTEVIGNTII